MGTPIVLAIVLLVWMPFYIWTEYRWKQSSYLWTKFIASLLFLSVAVSAYMIFGVREDYAIWVIAALVLGLIGDVLLVYPKRPVCFVLGLVSFLIGQIVYGVTFGRFVGYHWFDILVYLAIVGGALFAQWRVRIDFGKMKLPVLAYLLIISYMFTMAVSAIYKTGFTPVVTALIAVGAVLFYASDIVLAFVLFEEKPHKSLRAINLSLYYGAQLVLALTVAAMAM